MAKTNAAESNAVVQHAGGALPALLDEMDGLEGFGTSGATDDNIVPFLSLLQDMSPEVKKRDSAYVEGAEPGCLLNKATRALYLPNRDTLVYEDRAGNPLRLQPCEFQRVVMEWRPRDAGGGIVARHPHSAPTIEETLRELGGRQVPDPRDSSGKKMIWRSREDYDLIDTRYHFVNVLGAGGRLSPAVMGFSSTGHSSSRGWMSLMREAVLPSPTGPRLAPSAFKFYGVKALTRKNNQGEWFILSFVDLGDAGWVTDKWMRDAGLAFGKSVRSGAVRAADEAPDEGGEASPI